MKTQWMKPSDIEESWYQIDAEGLVLGRLATKVSRILLGKAEPLFTPGVDPQNYVVILNADKVVVTGNKMTQKIYYRHTGYTGHLKTMTLADKLAKAPEDVIRSAVKGMLPSNKLGRKLLKHLKVYTGSEHQHQAQKPELLVV